MTIWLQLLNIRVGFCNAVTLVYEGINKIKERQEQLEEIINFSNKFLQEIFNFFFKITEIIKEKIANSKINKAKRNKEYKGNIPKIIFKDFIQVSKNDIAQQVVDAMISREFCYILSSPYREKEKLVVCQLCFEE